MKEFPAKAVDYRFSILLLLLVMVIGEFVAIIVWPRFGIPKPVAIALGCQATLVAWAAWFVGRRRIDAAAVFGPLPGWRPMARWSGITALYVVSVAAVALLVIAAFVDPAELDGPTDFFDSNKALLAVVGVLVAPLVEEFVFRGLVLRNCLQRSRPAVAVLVSAVPFAVMHMEPTMVIQFGFGVLAAVAYLATRSLWVTITMHVCNNALADLLLLPLQSPWVNARLPAWFDLPHVPAAVAVPAVAAIVLGWGIAMTRLLRGLSTAAVPVDARLLQAA